MKESIKTYTQIADYVQVSLKIQVLEVLRSADITEVSPFMHVVIQHSFIRGGGRRVAYKHVYFNSLLRFILLRKFAALSWISPHVMCVQYRGDIMINVEVLNIPYTCRMISRHGTEHERYESTEHPPRY